MLPRYSWKVQNDVDTNRYTNANFEILLRDFDPESLPKHEPEPDSH